ncbi:efflux RND transporter periplasmic adaptor subunit [Methylocella sp.]|uniref:efflux RND transporter periplasmic adaptor subunit n=1 Tax=Methylocella sp. TaxID=1978226 RepID=UPI003783F3A8
MTHQPPTSAHGRRRSGLPLLCAALACASAAQGATTAEPATAAHGVPVHVAQAESGCFTQTINLGAYLQPRAYAVVVVLLDTYQVVEILVGAGEEVVEGQPLARLQKIEGPNPYPAGMGPPAPAGPPLPASIVLRAPTAGVVVESRARLGASFDPKEPLYRIAVDGLIEAMAQVPSVHINALKPDQEAVVTLDDGRELPGRVRRIGAAIDPQTQMGEARIAFERDPGARVGRLARVRVEARRSCGLAIPRSAIFYSAEGPSVQIVRGRLVETARVRVGLRSGEAVEIREGLRAGDLVVLNAGGSLRDGDAVAPILTPAPDAGPALSGGGQPEERR